MRRDYKPLIAISAVLFVSFLMMSAQGRAGQDSREAAEAAIRELELEGFSGSVLVARDGIVQFSRDAGFDSDQSTTPSYWIASITKQFAAAAALLLQEQGKLDIHESIASYLPEVPADKSAITVFQLLTHTSGLQQHYAADGITNREAALEALLAPALESTPGETFSYANDNYNILAIVLEICSGKTYEDLLRDAVFGVAQMRHTEFWGMPIEDGTFVPPVATPIGQQFLAPNWGFRGATGMRASVQDLYAFIESLRAGELISEDSVALLMGNHIQTPGGTEIGFNWFARRMEDGQYARFSRGNESFGGNAVIYYYPESELTIITATNAGPAEIGDGPVKGWSRVTHEVLADIYLNE